MQFGEIKVFYQFLYLFYFLGFFFMIAGAIMNFIHIKTKLATFLLVLGSMIGIVGLTKEEFFFNFPTPYNYQIFSINKHGSIANVSDGFSYNIVLIAI